jgi:hypothetical protein
VANSASGAVAIGVSSRRVSSATPATLIATPAQISHVAAVMGPYYPRLAFCPLRTLTAYGPAACMRAAVAPTRQVNAAVRTGGSAGRLIATALFVCVMVVWVALEAFQGLRRRRRTDRHVRWRLPARLVVPDAGPLLHLRRHDQFRPAGHHHRPVPVRPPSQYLGAGRHSADRLRLPDPRRGERPFGDRYTSYAAQRKRLVPFVW